MHRPFSTVSDSVATIVTGARMLAVGKDLDPDTMEDIVRKAVRVAREALLQDARATRAND